jgi:hypothetical protein
LFWSSDCFPSCSGYGGTDCAKQGSGTQIFGDNGNKGGNTNNGGNKGDTTGTPKTDDDETGRVNAKTCKYSEWKDVKGAACDCKTKTKPQRRLLTEVRCL